MNALDYFLKANLYGLLFASCYWLFLRRHTFFRLNRAYLLLTAILSLILPLVILPTQAVETLPETIPIGVITLPVSTIGAAPVDAVQASPTTDWEQLELGGYALIALMLFVRLAIRVGRLMGLIRKSPRQAREGYVLVQPNDPTLPTFSFFQYVILNPADTHNDLILQHELVHVRQCHSADVLGIGLLRALFWACPTLWLLDRMLRQVHEFLADKPARRPTEYAQFLVHYSFGIQSDLNGTDTLTNSFFNPSLLKQRILMLHQKATTRWALGKYMLVLPLAVGLLAMTTAREQIATMVNQTTDEPITVSGRVIGADGKPLQSVSIMDGKRLSRTDKNGYYRLPDLSNPSTLMFSHTGFKAVTHEITHTAKLNITLQLISEELPIMGATDAYKAVKPNPTMPVRTPPSSQTINGTILTAVEEPAVFSTGIPGLMQYVAHALRYPSKARAAGVEGNVFVQFVVLPTGAIGSAKIKKGIGSGCDEEALRIVRQMPKWIPAQQNGKPVATQYVLPIQFALEKKEDQRTGKVSDNQLNDVYVFGYESLPTSIAKSTNQRSRTSEVFTVVEQVPEFPGGMKALGEYLGRNLRYPSEAQHNKVQGRVFVQFVVSQMGEIRNLRVLKGIGGGCDEEAVRVVSQMPKWNPGQQGGKAVAVQYTLPIQFTLEKWEDKRTGQVSTPQPDSSKKMGVILDSSKRGRFALYNDVYPTSIRLPDSLWKPRSSFMTRSDMEPLFIIDGVEAPKGEVSKIAPKDIESVTALKDAAATAAYGEKGKGGIILITLKKK